MALPKLSAEEKLKALEKAESIRSQRAAIREELKSGKMTLRQVLERADDEVIAKMRVTYLLESLPHVGKVKSRRIMNEIGIHENRRVQGLGKRQINALLERF